MKYLENDQLQQLTALLTDAAVQGHSRVVNGRLEAYSMKRAGSDKKYSKSLGERYVAWQESLENQLLVSHKLQQLQQQSQLQQQQQQSHSPGGRKRSQSAATFQEAGKIGKSSGMDKSDDIDEAAGTATAGTAVVASKYAKVGRGGRMRAASVDMAEIPARPSTVTQKARGESAGTISNSNASKGQNAHSYFSQPTPLGDFSELSTRKLMTNLILTLNASFPDYDFSSVKPADFELVKAPMAVQAVNERLSELAIDADTKNNYSNCYNNSSSSASGLANQHHHGASGGAGGSGGCGSGTGVGPHYNHYEACATPQLYSNTSFFLSNLWTAVDAQISLQECDVYSYQPAATDCTDDPLSFLTETLLPPKETDDLSDMLLTDDARDNAASAGTDSTVLWSFNYFFVNRHLKRIVFFTCIETINMMQPVVSMEHDVDNDIDVDADNADKMGTMPERSDNGNECSSSRWSSFAGTDDAADLDFDLDPSATAGGVAISTV
jgi:hypothetical protein